MRRGERAAAELHAVSWRGRRGHAPLLCVRYSHSPARPFQGAARLQHAPCRPLAPGASPLCLRAAGARACTHALPASRARAALRGNACRAPCPTHPAALQLAVLLAWLSARPATLRVAATICRPPPTALMARCFRSSTPPRRWTTAGALRGIAAAGTPASGALQLRTLLTHVAPRCRAPQHRRGSALQGRRRAGACLLVRGCSAVRAVSDAMQRACCPRSCACFVDRGLRSWW